MYKDFTVQMQVAFLIWVSVAAAATVAGAITGYLTATGSPGLGALVGGLTAYAGSGTLGATIMGFQAQKLNTK